MPASQQVVELTTMGIILQWAPTIVALAAIYGMSANVTHQVRATAMLAYRSKWIECFRADLAKLLALQASLAFSLQQNAESSAATVEDRLSELFELTHRLRLLLNPEDEKHKALMVTLQELGALFADPESSSADDTKRPGQYVRAVVDAAYPVLAAEWRHITRAT